MGRQFAEAFHDVFGEEHSLVLFFAAKRVIADRVYDMDIGRMHGCSMGEPKDVYEFVNKYVHIGSRQC